MPDLVTLYGTRPDGAKGLLWVGIGLHRLTSRPWWGDVEVVRVRHCADRDEALRVRAEAIDQGKPWYPPESRWRRGAGAVKP